MTPDDLSLTDDADRDDPAGDKRTDGYHGDGLGRAVDRLLDAGAPPRIVFQPIVDLVHRRTVGYEALSRFPGPPYAPPDEWFAAARRIGRGDELEAIALREALTARADVPPNCFLSLNISPNALLSPPVRRVLGRGGVLSSLVFELTEHAAVADYSTLALAIGDVRRLGGYVAVDDAGAGYSTLRHILKLRPDFVKLDRTLIAGIQLDEAKAALVEMFGGFTSRVDAWLLAEGVEHPSELHRLQQLDVPLGQGFLLGRPGPGMDPLPDNVSALLAPPTEHLGDDIGRFTEAAPTIGLDATEDELTTILETQPDRTGVVLLDVAGRPRQVAMLGWPLGLERRPVAYVLDSTDIGQALQRAMTRPLTRRFDPLMCCDAAGNYLGVVLIERLVEAIIAR